MISAKKQVFIALSYLLLASSLGIILRLFPVTNVEATYKYIIHTHSHIALLGWVYISLTTLLYHLFIKKNQQKKFRNIFWATHFTILGMLFSFPFTGYALISIIFSTLFLICSYWFYFLFKRYNYLKKSSYVYKFINASLIFMTISSIGPWALGIIMNTLGNTSSLYKNAIYFYLHFQYNGWFIFCLLGLFFYFLETIKAKVESSLISTFYKLMIISCILTLFLSFLWTKPNITIYILAALGGIIQFVTFLKFYKIISTYKEQIIKKTSINMVRLLKFIFFLLITKVVLQLLTSIPYFAEITSQIKDFVIGYLHLVFLGITSLSIFFFVYQQKLLNLNKTGLIIFLVGFILSESLIFYKGFCNWQQLSIINNYYLILVIASALMPIGILSIFIKNIKPTFSSLKESL